MERLWQRGQPPNHAFSPPSGSHTHQPKLRIVDGKIVAFEGFSDLADTLSDVLNS